MKCWKVRRNDDADSCAEVVFADTANEARSKCVGRDAFHDLDYTDLRAERFAKYDGREDDPPTIGELVRNDGWWVECQGCLDIIGGNYNANSDIGSGMVLGGEECGRCYCGNCWPLKLQGTLPDPMDEISRSGDVDMEDDS